MKIAKEKRGRKIGRGKREVYKGRRNRCVLWSLYHIICVYSNGAARAGRGGARRDASGECEPRPGTTSGSCTLPRTLPGKSYEPRLCVSPCVCVCVCHDCANTITYRAERESVNTAPCTPRTTRYPPQLLCHVNCGHARVLLHCFRHTPAPLPPPPFPTALPNPSLTFVRRN